MSDMTPRIVIGLGEVLWDIFPDGSQPGGAPANVAFHATQLGERGVVVSRVGCDDQGDRMIHVLSEQGLETTYIQRDEEHATGCVTVNACDPNRPSYTIHENVAYDYLAASKDLLTMMGGVSAVCVGTLAQRNAISRRSIHQCLAAAGQAIIVYDINVRPPWLDRSWVEATLRKAHVLKLNIDEVAVVSDLLFGSVLTSAAFAKRIHHDFGPGLICVTQAEAGCCLYDTVDDRCVEVPGEEVEVVSAVGAGDAFSAALIHGLLQDWPLEAVGSYANKVGALVAGRAGAMPNLMEALEQIDSP